MSVNSTIQVPDGYMMDSKGRMIPESMVKEIDKIRDEMILEIIPQAAEVSQTLTKLKEKAFSLIDDFCELSASEYGKEVGGNKGNATFITYDGEFKLMRAINDDFEFDERLQIAKNLIDQCINDWSTTIPPELKVLVNGVFEVDKKGQVSVQGVLGLRKYNIDDPRWLKAMTAISDSLKTVGSRTYIRVYKRVDQNKWKLIPLSIAGA